MSFFQQLICLFCITEYRQVSGLFNLLRGNSVCLIVCQLLFAATVRFINRQFHTIRHLISIHDYLTVHITRGTSRSLCQRTVGAEESFFVCIENSDERHFRKVETLTKQVDPDKYVINSLPEIIHNLHTFQCVDITMDIGTSHIIIKKIFCQFFCHSFG